MLLGLIEEFKKSIKISKYPLALVAVIVFQTVMCFAIPQKYNYQIEIYKEDYFRYLNIFEGKLSPEKEAALASESERLEAEENEYTNAMTQLLSGEISNEEYDRITKEYKGAYGKKKAFEQIQSQVYYARLDPERRYIAYENGWTVLLRETMPDFIAIIAVAFVVCRIFCCEYESKMHSLIISTKHGKRSVVFSKLAVSAVFAFSFGAVSMLIKVIYAALRFGLYNPQYPVQSLSIFEACEYTMSLFECFALSVVLKLFGLLITSVLTAFVSVLLKRGSFALFWGAALSILPYFVFDIRFVMKRLPNVAFSVACNYFSGVETVAPDSSYVTEAIPKSDFVLCCISALFIFSALNFLVYFCWSKKSLKAVKKV